MVGGYYSEELVTFVHRYSIILTMRIKNLLRSSTYTALIGGGLPTKAFTKRVNTKG